MARFIIQTASAAGHVNPIMSIARRLVEREHDVTWLTGRRYRTNVERTGATFHPVPEAVDPGDVEIYDFYPELKRLEGLAQIKYYLKDIFLANSPAHIQALDEILESGPADVLVSDNVSYGTFFKAELANIPSAMISVLPLSISSRDTGPFGMGLLPPRSRLERVRYRALVLLGSYVVLRDVNAYANEVRRGLELAPFRAPFLQGIYHLPSAVLQLSTPAFEYPRSDQPAHLHFVGPILADRDPAFSPPAWWSDLDSARAVVLVNQGTLANDLDDLIRPTIEALKNEDVLVIAVPASRERLGNLPENVRAEPFVPFAELLPHVDLMVTNGGYGGTQLALAHGIPLVVAGDKEDKMEVAAHVEWSGAGINLRTHRPASSVLKDTVKKVLTEQSYRKNAQRIQQDFAQYDAPAHAAALLESLVRVGNAPVHA